MTDTEIFDTGKYKHTPIHEVTLHEYLKMCEDPSEVITDLQGRIITGPRRIEQSKQILTQKYLENKAIAKEKGLAVATHEVLADPDWKPEPINIKPNKEQEPMSDGKPVLNKKGKPFTWSFSAINDFDPELGGCPKKYAHARFWCDTPFVETEALRWGNEVHKALEHRIKYGKELPDGMKQWEKYAAALLKAAEGHTIIAEDKIALTRKFGVTGYFDKDAWGRGAADVLIIKGDTAYIYDWKTGKPKDNTFQLQIYAAMIALKYSQVQRVIPKFIFLKHDKVLPEKELVITREELKPILVDILNRTKRMEEAWKTNNFPAVTSGLCGWCDARKECSHYEGKR